MSWADYIAGGRQDTQLRNRLIAPTIPRVERRAHAFAVAKRTPDLRDDFTQAGCMTLMRCADTYDPGRGTQFWSWAYRPVLFSMVDVLRMQDFASRSMRLKAKRRNEAQVVSLTTCRQSTEELDQAAGSSKVCGEVAVIGDLEVEAVTASPLDGMCIQEDMAQLKQRMATDLSMDDCCLLWLHVTHGVAQADLAALFGVHRMVITRRIAGAVRALRRDPVEAALWEVVDEL